MSSAGKEGGRVAALYIRVSTLDQAREGYSLAAQQAALEAWAAQKSYATQLYADEGISGKDIDHRPAMRQILADVEAGKIAVVAVWALSRLTRSVADLYATWELLAAHGVGLVSHTEGFDTGSPTGRAMMGLLGVFAQMEREITAERVRAAMEQLQAQAKAPLAVREEGETLVVETLYGEKRLPRQTVLAERCRSCKTKKMACYDELLGEDGTDCGDGRMEGVRRLEAMTPDERFRFWQGELSRCIRCNACRNVCPACSCEKCVFDNPASGVENKAAANSFEENLFHIIRAFHVAGRCTDCGECSRVCPQHIPLHLLNRKLIADMNELYGPYQAGADLESRPPLMDFRFDDPEPSTARRGGAQ